ncbi:hypothetical protein GCM10020331_027420 [Ectobacillus funiculus]
MKGQVVTFHQSAEFFYERGMKAYRRNNLQEAVKYLKRAVDVKKEPFMLCQLAITLSEVGEYHESNQIFLGGVTCGFYCEGMPLFYGK